jgi:hypothetical protein
MDGQIFQIVKVLYCKQWSNILIAVIPHVYCGVACLPPCSDLRMGTVGALLQAQSPDYTRTRATQQRNVFLIAS